ncbi:MAG: hypothetical protein AABY11_02715 [archaeon]
MPSPSVHSPASPFETRLKKPDASIRTRGPGSESLTLHLDACLSNGKLSALGFSSDASPAFRAFFSRACALFLGKTQVELEQFGLSAAHEALSPFSPEEKSWVLFSWNVLQDVTSRLPFDDPMSRMITKISRLHDEFPSGKLSADEED